MNASFPLSTVFSLQLVVSITFFHLVHVDFDLLCSVHVALDLLPVVASLGLIVHSGCRETGTTTRYASCLPARVASYPCTRA